MNSTLGSVVPLAMFPEYISPTAIHQTKLLSTPIWCFIFWLPMQLSFLTKQTLLWHLGDKNIERGAKETEQVDTLSQTPKIYGNLCLGPVLEEKEVAWRQIGKEIGMRGGKKAPKGGGTYSGERVAARMRTRLISPLPHINISSGSKSKKVRKSPEKWFFKQ